MTATKQVVRLMEAFPRSRVGTETLRVYTEELAHLPADVLEAAVRDVIRTHETDWPPTIAQVLRAAAEATLALPTESEALDQIQARLAAARAGSNEAPLHPLVRQSLQAVGGLLFFKQGDGGVVRGQFSRVYRDAREAAVRAEIRRP